MTVLSDIYLLPKWTSIFEIRKQIWIEKGVFFFSFKFLAFNPRWVMPNGFYETISYSFPVKVGIANRYGSF